LFWLKKYSPCLFVFIVSVFSFSLEKFLEEAEEIDDLVALLQGEFII